MNETPNHIVFCMIHTTIKLKRDGTCLYCQWAKDRREEASQ